jgi:hypothetical protein
VATNVQEIQVIPGLRPRNDRAIWKRIVAVLDGLRSSKPADLKVSAALEANDQELHRLAKRVKSGPDDRDRDAMAIIYGGGVYGMTIGRDW